MRRVLLITCLSVAIVALIVTRAASAASVGVVGANVLVRPSERPATSNVLRLVAAGNEFESAQVVVQADGAMLHGVRASVVGTLASSAGVTIPASAFTIYRVGYADLRGRPSDGDLGGVLGRYPDALIPAVDPVWNEPRRAFPVDVAAGENQLVWLDVLAPAGHPAGIYRGASVRVTADGGFARDVPIELEVMDLDMPSSTTLDGGFDLNSNQLCRAHDCASITGGQAALHATYARVALDNRVSLAKPPHAEPASSTDAGYLAHTRPLLTGEARTRLPGARLRTVTIYQWAKASAGRWRTIAHAAGVTDRVRFHCDEIGTHTALWTACRNDWQSANAAWRGATPAGQPVTDLPLEVTASIDDVTWARGNGFADLVDRIAVLIPVINYVHPKDVPAFPGRRAAFAAWNSGTTPGGAAKSLWSYTSCMSMGCSADQDDRHPLWSGWASYGVDQPASQARAMGWVSYAYDLQGEYYYETARDLPSAWTNLWSNDGGNHGDGTLFYPGTVARIGGTHDTAIESIRLKRIRDGHEDHELLVAADAASNRARVLAIARGAFDTAFTTDVTQDRIDAARTQLFTIAAGSTPRTTWPAPAPTHPEVAAPSTPPAPKVTATAPESATGSAPVDRSTRVTSAPIPAAVRPPVMCGGRRATIIGTARADVLRGTRGPDVIAALGGNDRIVGLGGGDTICTGTGNDIVTTWTGSRRRADVVICGSGRDTVAYDRADRLRGTCERRSRRR